MSKRGKAPIVRGPGSAAADQETELAKQRSDRRDEEDETLDLNGATHVKVVSGKIFPHALVGRAGVRFHPF